MARIYHRRAKKQRPYSGGPVVNVRNTTEISDEERCCVEIIRLMFLLGGVERRPIVFDSSLEDLAAYLGFPPALVFAQWACMIDRGDLGYLPDGAIEIFPEMRRRIDAFKRGEGL